jgi:hypothetical protein
VKDALRDAFMAGWSARMDDGATRYGADKAFSDWYQRVTETLDRAPICPDNSHDYRVDDSDGLLKCTTCGKVLF